MFADDGETRTGLWLMIEAPDRAGAETFIAGEGFNRAGMFGEIEIKRFVFTRSGARRQVDIAPDPACRMFICEFVGGSLADSDLRNMADRAVACGLTTTDDGSQTLGAVAIVEAVDRAAAEALVAAEPLAGAGRRIDRWRFGKSVV